VAVLAHRVRSAMAAVEIADRGDAGGERFAFDRGEIRIP
jgi:hypothetical protein